MRAHLRRPRPVAALLALPLVFLVACDDAPDGGATSGGASGAAPTSGSAGAPAAGATNAGSAGSSGGSAPNAGGGGQATGGTGTAGTGGVMAGAGGGNAGAMNAGGSGAGAGGASGAGTAGQAGGGGDVNPAGGNAGAGGAGAEGGSGAAGGTGGPLSVLAFSRTTGFRHDSIPTALEALDSLAAERDWTVTATEDPAVFSDDGLEAVDVVVFVMTTGDDILSDAQQAAFERYIRSGRGFAGIHSASDTEFGWTFYGELVGAYFREHPAIQRATLQVENREHPSTAHLMQTWTRTDEWYAFDVNPRERVEVLLSLDETSYDPGTSTMNGDHPIAWFREYEGGRSFHTALGHTRESYAEPAFLAHIAGGIEWAGGRVAALRQ